jgi:hypothetical protein
MKAPSIVKFTLLSAGLLPFVSPSAIAAPILLASGEACGLAYVDYSYQVYEPFHLPAGVASAEPGEQKSLSGTLFSQGSLTVSRDIGSCGNNPPCPLGKDCIIGGSLPNAIGVFSLELAVSGIVTSIINAGSGFTFGELNIVGSGLADGINETWSIAEPVRSLDLTDLVLSTGFSVGPGVFPFSLTISGFAQSPTNGVAQGGVLPLTVAALRVDVISVALTQDRFDVPCNCVPEPGQFALFSLGLFVLTLSLERANARKQKCL